MMGDLVAGGLKEPAVTSPRDESKKFMELSIKIAEKFLQTVVFIDDEPIYDTVKVGQINSVPGKKVIETTDKNGEPEDNTLNAKLLMDTFALKGMICTVLKPNAENTAQYITNSAVKKADVLVLDWRLNSDNGEKAIEIINELIRNDAHANSDKQRLRLIILYSGVDKDKIFVEMASKLSGFSKDQKSYNLRLGHLSITIINKNEISEETLPDCIYKEFAQITSGLVSNVALEAMSVLRDNTHLLLSKVDPEIDPSFMAHRSLLPNPEDSQDHAVEIITSEISSILDNYGVGNVANSDSAKAWIIHHNICEKPKTLGLTPNFIATAGAASAAAVTAAAPVAQKEPFVITRDMMISWQDSGIEKSIWFKNIEKERRIELSEIIHNQLTQMFCKDRQNDSNLDRKFAILTTQKSIYRDDYKPILTLGTIIREIDPTSSQYSGNYLLCIQPKCNCVRVIGDRDFSFLKLSKAAKGESFNIIIKDDLIKDDQYIPLKINYKIFESQLLKFKVDTTDKDKVVKATEENGKILFTSKDGKKYRWITELNTEQAQRTSNKFASILSRVGLNESEWLRRSANIGQDFET